MEKHALHRAGAACAVAGAVVAGAFNAIHPEAGPPDAFLTQVAGTSQWAAIHWGLMVGLVLMQFGYAAFMLTLRDPAETRDAGGWGLVGVYTLLMGTALFIALFAVEAALKPLADAAKADPSVKSAALALAGAGDGLETASIFVYWVGILLLGVALALSTRYPRWMGGVGVLTGAVGSIGVGLVRAFQGPSAWTDRIGLPIVGVVTFVWTIVLGVLLWRLTMPSTTKARRAGRRS